MTVCACKVAVCVSFAFGSLSAFLNLLILEDCRFEVHLLLGLLLTLHLQARRQGVVVVVGGGGGGGGGVRGGSLPF